MDNLFSFPAAALSASSSTQSGASDAPAQELSARETPISPAFEMAEQSAHVHVPSDSLSSADLHVRLKLLDERVFDVHVDRGVTVLDFRATVERVTAIPATVLRLIYRGKLLKDSALLSSYEIQDGHTIHVVAPRAGTAAAALTASSSPPSISTAFTPATTTERPDPRDVLRQRLNRLAGHSSVSTPATATASTTTDRPVSRDLRARLSRMRRSPEQLRQTTEEEPQRATPSSLSDGGATRLSRVRRPGFGEPTGDAWNLAVLREALGQHSDRIPARPSNRDAATMDSLRQGNEQRQMADNDSPVDTVASMGLDATTSATEQQPNLDYLSQGILTLRTVLSTAAVPQQETQVVEEEATERQEAVENAEISSHHGEEPTQQNQVRTPTVSPRRGRRRFFVGQWLDVKDTVNQWLECTVMDMSEDKVLVHYHGWPSRWDEWLDFDSPRIAAFRTRTQHTHNAVHLSPAPSTRLPNAPGVGENDMRRIIPQIRDLMEEVLPYVDQLATLCDDESQGEDDEFDDGSRARRREELSEIAHLVAPFFDRFGRLLVDSARQLDPLLHPDLRHDERRRRLLRARGSAPSRQTTPAASTVPVGDSAVGIRDLITPATRPPQEAQNARRSIDVHIHAIVAPSSLSSLASLARLGTAIAGAMGSSSRSNSPALEANPRSAGEIDEAFGIPRLRPLQGGSGDRSVVTDSHEPDEEDARYTDTSRTPLLSSFRRDNPSRPSIRDSITNRRGEADTLLRPRRPVRSSSTRLHDFLSDDFFGPSFSQDSDDMEDPVTRDGFGTPDHGQDDVVQYEEIPSPRESEGDQHRLSENEEPPRIGVIPEIEELERIERGRRAQHGASSSSEDAGRSSSASSTSSSGYPTFLEVMRRTLSGVRGFGFSSSSSSLQSEEPSAGTPGTPTTPVTPAQRATRSDSSSSSSSFSVGAVDSPESNTDHLAEARFVMQSNNPVLAFSRLRQPSSVSSIEEDLDSVD